MGSIATRSLDEIDAAPLRKVRFWEPEIETEARPDGSVLVRQLGALGAYPDRLTDRLVHFATTTPDRTYLAERDARGDWRTLTYAETLDSVRRIGTALLGFDLSPERPIAILSGNDIEHALIGLAAQYVGIPYAPISPAYSLVSSDFSKLKDIIAALTPGLVFAADGAPFEEAIAAAVPAGVPVVTTRRPIEGRGKATFADLVATELSAAVDDGASARRARHDRQDPLHLRVDRLAKGRDQHAAHALRQPGDGARLLRLPRGRAAGRARLGAVEPHGGRQQGLQHGAL